MDTINSRLESFDRLNKDLMSKNTCHTSLSLITNSSGEIYVKKIKDDKKLQQQEYANLRSINHINIIKTHGYNNTDNSILLDYVLGKDLLEFLESGVVLSEYDIYKIFSQLVRAVHYLHENNMVHRDLKLENIMIKYNDFNSIDSIKLIDFEYARYLNSDKRINIYELSGTMSYLAPEFLPYIIDKKYSNDFNKRYFLKNNLDDIYYNAIAVDCWNLGIILYELVFHSPPRYNMCDESSNNIDFLEENDSSEIIYSNVICNPKFKLWDNKNKKLKKLMMGLLNLNPEKRFTTQDILLSSWIKNFDSLEPHNAENLNYPIIIIKNNKYFEIPSDIIFNKKIKNSQLRTLNEEEIIKLSIKNKKLCLLL